MPRSRAVLAAALGAALAVSLAVTAPATPATGQPGDQACDGGERAR
ncbi:hypothetical protein AB0O67_27795 [Streptomyces sp. NPDC086077]